MFGLTAYLPCAFHVGPGLGRRLGGNSLSAPCRDPRGRLRSPLDNIFAFSLLAADLSGEASRIGVAADDLAPKKLYLARKTASRKSNTDVGRLWVRSPLVDARASHLTAAPSKAQR